MAAPSMGVPLVATTSNSNFTEAVINFSNTGDNTVISGSANKSFRVFRIFFVSSAATTITFKSGSTSLTGEITVAAGGAFVLDLQGEPWFRGAAAADAFIIGQSGTAQVSGRVYYQVS